MKPEMPEKVALDVKYWRKGNEPENPWTTATATTPTQKWNPEIYAYYVPESLVEQLRRERDRYKEALEKIADSLEDGGAYIVEDGFEEPKPCEHLRIAESPAPLFLHQRRGASERT